MSLHWSNVPVDFFEFLSNLLLVWSHQAEIIFVKRLIQGRKNVTRVRVESRSCDQGCRDNDAFTLSATLSINIDALTIQGNALSVAFKFTIIQYQLAAIKDS